MNYRPSSDAERLKNHALILPRGAGWMVVDVEGTAFLRLGGDEILYVGDTPYYWSTRQAARENLQRWLGRPPKRGRKRNPSKPPERAARMRFERLFGCLMYLWKSYPGAITLDSVQRHVQKMMGQEFHQRQFRRDMESLLAYGYCVKQGPTYTAVPEYRRWWSDEFVDRPTPKSGEEA
jgi:hypothetical protein